MSMLEKRFYHRQEIAKIVGIANLRDGHFAEKVKRYLDNRRYGYNYSSKGVTITRLPQTAEERLTFLLVDAVGLDVQIDVYDFACYIDAFSAIDGFDSMPWDLRTTLFQQCYDNQVSSITLQRWNKLLRETNHITRFKKGSLWQTVKNADGSKTQISADPESEAYIEYCKKRQKLLSGFHQADRITRKNMWSSMVQELYPEYGVYYYSPQFVMNALGEQAAEISRLVAAVLEEKRAGQNRIEDKKTQEGGSSCVFSFFLKVDE